MAAGLLRSWLHSLARARSSRSHRRWTPLAVQQLEQRCLPSTLLTLAAFDGVNGSSPNGGLVADSNGNLYGTTQSDASNFGAIFEWSPGNNTFTRLASFGGPNGADPQAGLLMDSNGNLFGTTYYAGTNDDGTVFELPHGSSTITVLASFTGSNGAHPVGGLIMDSNGNLFGTTRLGGTNNVGTLFELAHGSNTITTLASFNTTNGANPIDTLVADGNGNFYGTARFGGANGAGTLFELPHGSNTLTALASFSNASGLNPIGTLTLDSNGNLFGTATGGGANSDGTLFELAHGSNTLTALVSFDGTSGMTPAGGLLEDSSGNFFGTTWSGGTGGAGTVFEVAHGSSAVTTLASFDGLNESIPNGHLWEDRYGNLFGTTAGGGPASAGVLFEITQPPTISLQAGNATATAGQTVPVSFTITASGTAPLTYQWQVSTDHGATFGTVNNGPGVAGAATATLTLSSFASAGAPEYRVVITDRNNLFTLSTPATLTVNAAPLFTTQPTNQSATVGQSGTTVFSSAAANGTAPWSYQWKLSIDGGHTFSNVRNNASISGATTAALSVGSGALPVLGAQYEVTVTDANGVTAVSTPAVLTVHAAPAFTTQPANATATVGQGNPVSFTVSAGGGTGPLSEQWQISTDHGATFANLSDGPGISGSSTTTLTVSGFAAVGSVTYRALVTDTHQVSASSSTATLTINPAPSPLTPNQHWLTQVYLDLFGRAVDASGLATWSHLLDQGVSRPQVVQYLENSLEYHTQVVQHLYAQLLHRSADAAGLSVFTTFLGSGGSVEQVEAALLSSPEYFNLHGGSNSGFLNGAYQDVLQRPLDAGGAQSWTAHLGAGTTLDAVATAILGSAEAQMDKVQGLFQQFLHRSADPSGLAAFTMVFEQGVPDEIVIGSIVGSAEYFGRAQSS